MAAATTTQLLLRVILQESCQENRWHFCEDISGRQIHPPPSRFRLNQCLQSEFDQ